MNIEDMNHVVMDRILKITYDSLGSPEEENYLVALTGQLDELAKLLSDTVNNFKEFDSLNEEDKSSNEEDESNPHGNKRRRL